MRNAFELQGLSQFGPLREPFDKAAIIEFEKLLEHEQGEQLWLCEFVRAF